MNDSKSQTDIGEEESNQLTLAMTGSGPRKSVARLRPMRSIANALGAVMRSRPSKVSVNFGMHLSHDNDSRKSSKIGTLGMTRRKMLDPKMELKQDRIDLFLVKIVYYFFLYVIDSPKIPSLHQFTESTDGSTIGLSLKGNLWRAEATH